MKTEDKMGALESEHLLTNDRWAAVLFLVFHLGSFSFIEAMEKEIINL